MIIGVLKEIMDKENRVAMTPWGVESLVEKGHNIIIEKNAGKNSGFKDSHYKESGAVIVSSNKKIYEKSDMVLHVKEPQPEEYDLIKENQIIFTYLHLAAHKILTNSLIKSRCIAIAYETVRDNKNNLPLLIPMSEVAGRLSVLSGALYLTNTYGKIGKLLGGVTGVDPTTVLILGCGTAGINAAHMASGFGAKVYLLDINVSRLRFLRQVMPKNCFLLYSTTKLIKKLTQEADLIIGAVLIPGAKSPKLITKAMLKKMNKGAVIVDISIDQGGCFETSKPTTHSDPVYEIDGIIHYCVANIPGAVARTSTIALTNSTLPYITKIADKGWVKASKENRAIMHGLNLVNGKVTCPGVADAFNLKYHPAESLINI